MILWLIWKPLGPTWTQMGSPALQAWLTCASLHPWFLSWPLTPVPARSVPWQPCGVGADGLHLSPCSVTDHVTLAKLLSHRMGVMILPPHSGAGRTRVRGDSSVFSFFIWTSGLSRGSPGCSDGRVCLQCRRPGFNPWVGEDPLEKEMASYSSILAWEILWMEEPGRLQSMGSQRVGHNWAALPTYWAFIPAILPMWFVRAPLSFR